MPPAAVNSSPQRPAEGYHTISFLSDYGLADEFVGVVHSVIAAIAPSARVVDITHQISPHDVRAGGLALARAAPYLCPGVVLAVVDPGVGTARRAVAVEVGHGVSVLVGPDNGLLGPAVALVGGATRAVELTDGRFHFERSDDLGPTFDGRDVFAPVAAHLCAGVPLGDLGAEIDPVSLTPAMLPVSQLDGDELVAEVLWVDRFGNCQLNVAPDDVQPLGEVVQLVVPDPASTTSANSPMPSLGAAPSLGAGPSGAHSGDVRTAVVARAYDHIPAGRVGLVVDSTGLMSVALARRSAAVELGLREGAEVRLRAADADEHAARSGGVVTPVSLGRN